MSNLNIHPVLKGAQVLVFIAAMAVLSVALKTLFRQGPFHGLKKMNTSEVLEQSTQRFPMIDFVVLEPSIRSTMHWSVLSIFRFAPWVNKVHVQNSQASDSDQDQDKKVKTLLESFQQGKNSRVVEIPQGMSLTEYCRTTPLLAEHFVVLNPHYVLNNYVYPWHFLVLDKIGYSPVWRNCRCGVVSLTRTLFNENCYHAHHNTIQQQLWHALKTGAEKNALRYQDNEDHFFSACSTKALLTSTRRVQTFKDEEFQLWLGDDRKKYDLVDTSKEEQPVQLFLVHDKDDVITYQDMFKVTPPICIWIHRNPSDHDLLTFRQRAYSMNAIFLDLDGKKYKWNVETLTAEIMRVVPKAVGVPFKYERVCSYAKKDDFTEDLLNEVANKLAAGYQCPFEPLSASAFADSSQEKIQSPEERRLRHL